MTTCVAIPIETGRAQEEFLKSYSTTVNYLSERCETDDNIAKVDNVMAKFDDNNAKFDENIAKVDDYIQKLTQRSLMASDYAQRLRVQRLKYGTLYNEQMFTAFFVEAVNKCICRTFRQ